MEGSDPIDVNWSVLRRASLWAFERTVAIYYQMVGGNPVGHGTGVLLQIADESFLLTAGHVLKDLPPGASLALGAAVEGARMMVPAELTGLRFEDTRTIDVAFLRLPSDLAARLGEHLKFLRMPELHLERSVSEGAFVLAGYPIELRRSDHAEKWVVANRFAYLSHLTDVDDAVEGTTIGLACRANILRHEDESEVRRMPHLEGISGCGIWRVWSGMLPPAGDRWNESMIRLVGIEHAYSRGKSIRGTLAGHAVQLIANAHPELRRSILVHRP